jgi:oligopeptide transport system permease protein
MADTVSPRDAQSSAATIEPRGQAALMSKGRKQSSLWGDAWRRLRKNKLAISGLVIVIIMALVAIFAPILAGEGLNDQDVMRQYARPSASLPMGADEFGRSVLARVIWGSRVSLLVGILSQVIVLVIGVVVGSLSGFFGGKTDLILMRVVDVFYAFPTLLFVVLLMSMFKTRGLGIIFVVIGLTSWVTLARLVRAQFLSLREKDYVVAARSIGADDMRLILKHMLPNALTPIIVALTFGVPTAIFTEAFLSFLGIGISPPNTSWGFMVGSNQSYLRSYPWMLLWPSAALALTMLSFTFLGDGLRDALDPSAKKD